MYTIRERNYLRSGHCRIVTGRFEHETEVRPHRHDLFEIALVVGGRCIHESALGRQPVSVGNAVILRPGAWHAMRETEELVVVNCLFSASLLATRLRWATEEPDLRRLLTDGLEPHGLMTLWLPPGGSARCEGLFARLPRLTDPEPTRSEYAAVAALLLALAELARGVALRGVMGRDVTTRDVATRDVTGRDVTARTDPPGPFAPDPTHPAVAKAAKLLRAQPARRWTVDDLAGAVGLSGPYLVRRFSREMGVSPIAYLARRRAEYAAAELLRSSKSVLEIGLDAGWPEPKHFARRFREHFGTSATEYRKRFARGT